MLDLIRDSSCGRRLGRECAGGCVDDGDPPIRLDREDLDAQTHEQQTARLRTGDMRLRNAGRATAEPADIRILTLDQECNVVRCLAVATGAVDARAAWVLPGLVANGTIRTVIHLLVPKARCWSPNPCLGVLVASGDPPRPGLR